MHTIQINLGKFSLFPTMSHETTLYLQVVVPVISDHYPACNTLSLPLVFDASLDLLGPRLRRVVPKLDISGS